MHLNSKRIVFKGFLKGVLLLGDFMPYHNKT